MTLFEPSPDELRRALRDLDLDSLTPLEALQKLAELKRNA